MKIFWKRLSKQSKFRFVDRGFKDNLVLIPGWATDYRIFGGLDLKYNYLLPIEVYPISFNDELIKFLRKNSLNKISFFGWSLGGFLAQDFALLNPEIVDELIFLGIRVKFERSLIEEIKKQLLKNKIGFLYKFYLDCFSKNDSEGLFWFKKNLLKDYCRVMDLKELLSQLDYLARARIKVGSLAMFKKIRIFHGEEDSIAPFAEACEIKSGLPQASFINMAGTGHALFLSKDFNERFYNG